MCRTQDHQLLGVVLADVQAEHVPVGEAGVLQAVQAGEVVGLAGEHRDVLLLLDEAGLVAHQLPDQVTGGSHLARVCVRLPAA